MNGLKTMFAAIILLGFAFGFACGDPGTNGGNGVGLCAFDNQQTQPISSDPVDPGNTTNAPLFRLSRPGADFN